MKSLTHYSAEPLGNLLRTSPILDNTHSPGGLWLSDDDSYGWLHYLERAVKDNPEEWRDASESWRCPTEFRIDTDDQLLWLKTENGLYQFTSEYGESQEQSCNSGQSGSGYGLHIDWDRVKADYKGILISPYQEGLSHHHGDTKFHWYRFGCASACVWDMSCLEPPPHITLVEHLEQLTEFDLANIRASLQERPTFPKGEA